MTKVYNGNNVATLGATNYTLNGLVGTDSATLTTTGGTYYSPDVSTTTTATFNGLALSFSSGSATDYSLSGTMVALTGSITPAPLTVTGAVVNNKPYDGTATTSLLNLGALNGVFGSDVVTINSSGVTANFTSKNAANNIPVTVTGYALGGANAADYSVASPAGLVANIIPATITIANAATVTKGYDGTNVATLGASANYTLNGFVGTDNATLTTTGGTYNTPDVFDGQHGDLQRTGAFLQQRSGDRLFAERNFRHTPCHHFSGDDFHYRRRDGCKVYNGNNTATLLPTNYTLNGLVGTDTTVHIEQWNLPRSRTRQLQGANGLGLSFSSGLAAALWVFGGHQSGDRLHRQRRHGDQGL